MMVARIHRSAFGVVAVCVTGASLWAQPCLPMGLPGWGAMGPTTVPDCATVWDPDGPGPSRARLVVGGTFSVAGDAVVYGLGAFDGARWAGVGGGLMGPQARPWSLLAWDSDLIVGGRFSLAGLSAADRVARWDGVGWSPLGGAFNGRVLALARLDQDLIAVGEFTLVDGAAVNHVARWDGVRWLAMGQGLPQSSRAVAVHEGLLHAADYPSGGGVGRVYRWNGSAWQAVSPGYPGGLSVLGSVNGELVAAGRTQAVIALRAGTWQALGNGGPRGISSMVEFRGELVVGGIAILGDYGTTVAAWDGGQWRAVDDSTANAHDFLPECKALVVHEGELVSAGNFQYIDGAVAHNVGYWDAQRWRGLPGGFNGRIMALHAWGERLFAGGEFAAAGGTEAYKAAECRGGAWQPIDPMGDAELSAMTHHAGVPHGLFLVGRPIERSAIRRLDTPASPPIVEIAGRLSCLASYNGTLMVGGDQFGPGGTIRGVARVSGQSVLQMGAGLNSDVHALFVWRGDLYAGGEFWQSGTTPVSCIARWNGTQWVDVGGGTGGVVTALGEYRGELVVGGHFSHAGVVAANCIALWNGARWTNLGAGSANMVFAVATIGDVLLAAGDFRTDAGPSAAFAACWNGTQWSAPADGPNEYVESIAVVGDTAYLGGWFQRAGDSVSAYLARWSFAPCACSGDYNDDGWLTHADVERLELIVNGLENLSLHDADFNQDGALNGFDIEALSIVVGGGPCP